MKYYAVLIFLFVFFGKLNSQVYWKTSNLKVACLSEPKASGKVLFMLEPNSPVIVYDNETFVTAEYLGKPIFLNRIGLGQKIGKLEYDYLNDKLIVENIKIERLKFIQDSLLKVELELLESKKLYIETRKSFLKISDNLISRYEDNFGYEIEFYNGFKKEIKYIYFYVQAYNPVKDKIDKLNAITGVGPIKAKDYGSYNFKNIWNTSQMDHVVLVSVKIEFMDKTIVQVKDIELLPNDFNH